METHLLTKFRSTQGIYNVHGGQRFFCEQVVFFSLHINLLFKGCVCYIFASLFCMSQRKHFTN